MVKMCIVLVIALTLLVQVCSLILSQELFCCVCKRTGKFDVTQNYLARSDMAHKSLVSHVEIQIDNGWQCVTSGWSFGNNMEMLTDWWLKCCVK